MIGDTPHVSAARRYLIACQSRPLRSTMTAAGVVVAALLSVALAVLALWFVQHQG